MKFQKGPSLRLEDMPLFASFENFHRNSKFALTNGLLRIFRHQRIFGKRLVMVLDCQADMWYSVVLYCFVWSGIVRYDPLSFCIILHGIVWSFRTRTAFGNPGISRVPAPCFYSNTSSSV